MSSRRCSATKLGSAGFTLVELLVALVVSALAAAGIYEGFISTSNAFTQTKAEGNAWQQARTAITVITQAVESAGYGLPMVNCTQIYSNNFQAQGGGLLSLAPVSAQTPTPTTLNPYDPGLSPINAGVSTYELQTVTGGGSYGSAPVTYISKVSSVNAAQVQVASSQSLLTSDIFLVALPNGSCMLGQITNTTLQSPSVVFNSGARGSSFNLAGGFSAIDPTVTPAQIQRAGFIDLGQAGFAVDNFFVGYRYNTASGSYDYNSVPSLYMQQYTSANGQGAAPPSELVARGVVDMQVEFGYGTRGSVTSWGPPNLSQPGRNVDAVKVALVVRDTRVLPNAGTRAGNIIPIFKNAVPAVTYTIPQALPANKTTGCLDGDCSHYLYRVMKTVIPVRNVIWDQ